MSPRLRASGRPRQGIKPSVACANSRAPSTSAPALRRGRAHRKRRSRRRRAARRRCSPACNWRGSARAEHVIPAAGGCSVMAAAAAPCVGAWSRSPRRPAGDADIDCGRGAGEGRGGVGHVCLFNRGLRNVGQCHPLASAMHSTNIARAPDPSDGVTRTLRGADHLNGTCTRGAEMAAEPEDPSAAANTIDRHRGTPPSTRPNDGRSPGSRVYAPHRLPGVIQWPWYGLAAYSCGGSCGIGTFVPHRIPCSLSCERPSMPPLSGPSGLLSM